jgi:hypothetical protein
MLPYVAGIVLLGVGVFAGLPHVVAAVAAGAGIALLLGYALVALRRSAVGPGGVGDSTDGGRIYGSPPHGHGAHHGHGHGGGFHGGGFGGFDGGGHGGGHGGH